MRRWPPAGRSRPGETDGSRIGGLDLPAHASPELRALLAKAAGPAEPSELADEPAAVAAFVAAFAATASTEHAAIPGTPSARDSAAQDPAAQNPAAQNPAAQHAAEPSTGPTMIPDQLRRRVRSLRFAAAAVVATLVFGGGLAAADALPAPAQRWVSSALGTLGIPVPSPDRGDQVGDAPERGRAPKPSAPALTVPSPSVNRPVPTPESVRSAGNGNPTAGTGKDPGSPAPAASPSASSPPQRPSPSPSPSSAPTGGTGRGAGNGSTRLDGTASAGTSNDDTGMQAAPRSTTTGGDSVADVSADRAPRN